MNEQQQEELGQLVGITLTHQGVTRSLPNLEAFMSDMSEIGERVDSIISQVLQKLRKDVQSLRWHGGEVCWDERCCCDVVDDVVDDFVVLLDRHLTFPTDDIQLN